jgi:hypothetical protein
MYLNECAAEEKRETAAMTLVIADNTTAQSHMHILNKTLLLLCRRATSKHQSRLLTCTLTVQGTIKANWYYAS